ERGTVAGRAASAAAYGAAGCRKARSRSSAPWRTRRRSMSWSTETRSGRPRRCRISFEPSTRFSRISSAALLTRWAIWRPGKRSVCSRRSGSASAISCGRALSRPMRSTTRSCAARPGAPRPDKHALKASRWRSRARWRSPPSAAAAGAAVADRVDQELSPLLKEGPMDAVRMRVLAILVVLAGASPARAQVEATIVGTVTDESKAVLPGVTVTATDLAIGRQFTDVSNARGEYRLVGLQASKYKLQAELAGFATEVFSEVELLVGQN